MIEGGNPYLSSYLARTEARIAASTASLATAGRVPPPPPLPTPVESAHAAPLAPPTETPSLTGVSDAERAAALATLYSPYSPSSPYSPTRGAAAFAARHYLLRGIDPALTSPYAHHGVFNTAGATYLDAMRSPSLPPPPSPSPSVRLASGLPNGSMLAPGDAGGDGAPPPAADISSDGGHMSESDTPCSLCVPSSPGGRSGRSCPSDSGIAPSETSPTEITAPVHMPLHGSASIAGSAFADGKTPHYATPRNRDVAKQAPEPPGTEQASRVGRTRADA